MVSVYIANTDNDWFDFLSSESDITEVNFWQPGAKSFHAIQPGELFVFRLKSPRDKISVLEYSAIVRSCLSKLRGNLSADQTVQPHMAICGLQSQDTESVKKSAPLQILAAEFLSSRFSSQLIFGWIYRVHGRKILSAGSAIRRMWRMDWTYGIGCRM